MIKLSKKAARLLIKTRDQLCDGGEEQVLDSMEKFVQMLRQAKRDHDRHSKKVSKAKTKTRKAGHVDTAAGEN